MKISLSKIRQKEVFITFAIFCYVAFFTFIVFTTIYSIVMKDSVLKPSYQLGDDEDVISTIENNLPLIYDSQNSLLTKNISYYEVIYDNTKLEIGKDEEILNKFDVLVGGDGRIVGKFLDFFSKSEYRHNDISIFSSVDKNLIGKLISSDISPYFKIIEHINRAYIDGEVMSGILGYFTPTSSQGLEGYFSNKFKNANIESVNLTIDKRLQTLVYNTSLKYLSENGIKSGLVTFSDDQGRILASSSFQSFNPNAFSNGDNVEIEKILNDPNKPLLNRLYDVVYPSGSIMKLLTSIAALEKNRISPSTIINSDGCMVVSDGISLCEFTRLPYGNLDIRNAIKMSSNIFFCKLFKEHGLTIDDLNEYQKNLV